MSEPFFTFFHYPPGIDVFREVMLELQAGYDWVWESPAGERLHFSEQWFDAESSFSVWLVRSLHDDGTARRGVIRAIQPEGKMAMIEFRDGLDLSMSEGQVVNIGPSFEAFTNHVYTFLLVKLLAAGLVQSGLVPDAPTSCAVLLDAKGQPRIIGEQEYYDLLHDVNTMRRYYDDYVARTAIQIARAMRLARARYIEKGGRWGPGIFSAFVDVTPRTVGRYLKAFWLAGFREIGGVEIPYKSRQAEP